MELPFFVFWGMGKGGFVGRPFYADCLFIYCGIVVFTRWRMLVSCGVESDVSEDVCLCIAIWCYEFDFDEFFSDSADV